MGRAAGEGSDFVVVTSDNPRSENPLDNHRGFPGRAARNKDTFIAEPDRRKAIGLALAEAQAGRHCSYRGKGHERTQTTSEGEFPFDDHEVASEELNRIGYKRGGAHA